MTHVVVHPVLSFLTPAYKTEAYLADTIESVMGQSDPSWELVVVDNGRSEEVADIVGTFLQDPRVRLVRQENQGYTGGVMAAAAAARGDFLCVLDSDDLLRQDYVRTMRGYLQAHPHVDALGCDAGLFMDGEQGTFGRGYLRSLGRRPPSRAGQALTVVDVLGGCVPYYSAAIRREAWDAVGGYEPGVPDIDESVLIWLRLAAQYEVRLIPDRLGVYRVREQSLSRDPAKVERFESSLIRTFEMFAEETRRPELRRAAERPVRRLRYHQALRRARWCFIDGDLEAARSFARDAYRGQHTVRAAAVMGVLWLPPRVLASVYPAKQRLSALGRRAIAQARTS
jgi:glycosyltransferase involved in cell wall biosynthesis